MTTHVGEVVDMLGHVQGSHGFQELKSWPRGLYLHVNVEVTQNQKLLGPQKCHGDKVRQLWKGSGWVTESAVTQQNPNAIPGPN